LLLHQETPEGLPPGSNDPNLLSTLFAAARYVVNSDLTVGGQLTLHTQTDYEIYAPRLTIGNKHRFSSSALELGFAAGVNHAPALEMVPSRNSFEMDVSVRAQAQVSPVAMVEAHAFLGYSNLLGEEQMFGLDDYMHQSYGFRLLFSASDAIDIATDFDVLYSDPDGDELTLLMLSVIARRLP
jgi:hypothetical protein